MGELHREVARRKEQRRAYEVGRGNGQGCDFAEGDYVLWSRVDTRLGGAKLQVRWVGPFRVVRALLHSFMVTHLITRDEYEVHGSRLKHYCDAVLGTTAEIRAHVATQGIVLGVRAIVDHRYDPAAQAWQLLVAWRGLEEEENSWEPFTAIHHDVPTLVAQYVESAGVSDLAALL
ncbi:unnamed protein product [Phytophthora fragariaefolia]|uniref:Unnamed protein product n=1 Tax=Phytophthora fragariaefolia TaxID=1490495 RepID=A0A9W6XUC8_9STRA|nr:unnamed protein product [Phytophthora fragariaefolia]